MQYDVFGPALKAYREDHNLSQQELASILGTSKQVISRYETGQREPKIGLAKEYAQKLGLPLSYFLGDNFKDTSSDIDIQLSDFEQEVIKQLRRLSEDQQRSFLSFLTSLISTQEP